MPSLECLPHPTEIRLITLESEREELFKHRWLVLRKPLGMPQGTEQDQYDADPRVDQAVAIYHQHIVGSARLRSLSPILGSIAYVAVLPAYQRRGIGTALMHFLIELGQQKHYQQLRLMSRTDSLDFYRTLGFNPAGEPVTVHGIPHQFMRLNLLVALDKTTDSSLN
ncbi:MAG: GNAT family N-acetyltransferase [Oscillatoriales cyanobacterium RM2_1_1]|nr:GNAT family N-acetyltransferase [Oscillatoriales cyanobacterium RM2_1_1]